MNSVAADGEAAKAETYVEDFTDACENLPTDVQRDLSRMIELDATCQGYLRDATTHMENLLHLLNCPDPEANQKEIDEISRKLQLVLISSQEIGDDKLQIVQHVQDTVDAKARQLDVDVKSLEVAKDSENPEADGQSMLNHPGRNSIFKKTRPIRIGTDVSSILGPTTLAPTRFAMDEQKLIDPKMELYQRACSGSSSDQLFTFPGMIKSEPGLNLPSTSKRRLSGHTGSSRLTFSSAVGGNSSLLHDGSASLDLLAAALNFKCKKQEKRKVVINEKQKRKYKKRKPKVEAPAQPQPAVPGDLDEATYCLCDKISYGEMIGCDNDLCPIEWFHFACVSLLVKPKGKWFCPNCRGDRPNVMKPKAIFLKELEKYNREKEEKD